MNKLSKQHLMSLEEYAERRPAYRSEIMAHKKHRHIALGNNIRVLFEDIKTIQYQIQEMLRIERIFERTGIEEELEAYNPLIPDGKNLKATMMIEYDDPIERKQKLAQLIGVEKVVYIQVEGYDKVHPICNEDMERDTEEKTSSVHFLRFEFTTSMLLAWRSGAQVMVGVDHPQCKVGPDPLSDVIKAALQADFASNLTSH